MTTSSTPAPNTSPTPVDRYLALSVRYHAGDTLGGVPTDREAIAEEMETLWQALGPDSQQAVQAVLVSYRTSAGQAPPAEFTTPDEELNRLLDATLMMTKGAGMDAGMYFYSALEDVLAKLPDPARDREPEVPFGWAEVGRSGACLMFTQDKAHLSRMPGSTVLALYQRHPRLKRPDTAQADQVTGVDGMVVAPCPFCGHQPDNTTDALDDSLHPVNREGTVWSFSCAEAEGGCGAQVLGDSPIDVMRRWNHRA